MAANEGSGEGSRFLRQSRTASHPACARLCSAALPLQRLV